MKIHIVAIDYGSIGDFTIFAAYTSRASAEKYIQDNYPDYKKVGDHSYHCGNEWITIHEQDLEP